MALEGGRRPGVQLGKCNNEAYNCNTPSQRGNVCPVRYFCIKYPDSSPKFILT